MKPQDYANMTIAAEDREQSMKEVLLAMNGEAKDLMISRSCKNIHSQRSVVLEMDDKWRAYCRILEKKNIRVRPDLFEAYFLATADMLGHRERYYAVYGRKTHLGREDQGLGVAMRNGKIDHVALVKDPLNPHARILKEENHEKR